MTEPVLGSRGVVHRTLFFALALLALFAAVNGGAARAYVLIWLVLFVVAATVWVRGQYADSLDGDAWLLPRSVCVAFCAIGVASVLAFVVWHGDGLGLAGVILIYFGVGSMVMRWRERSLHRSAWGTALLLGGIVAALVGSLLLGRLGSALHLLPVVCVALALLVLLPMGLALLSEETIGHLTDGDPSRAAWRLGGMLGGALVFCLLAVGAALWAGSPWVLAPLVCLGLLVFALASSTQADIAAVLAVLALLGTTPLDAPLPWSSEPRGSRNALVVLGDSYISGEGASIYFSGTDDGGGNTCHRSPTAWAAMAGQQRPFDGLAFLACSGATTRNVRTDMTSRPTPTPQIGEPGTQLEQYRALQSKGAFAPGLVVLSLGGNDAGFSMIGVMCLAPGNCSDRARLWNDALDQVEASLRGTYAEVRRTFPRTPVAVIPYPEPIDTTAKKCGQVVLSSAERRFLTDFVRNLNARVGRAAAANGFYFLKEMQASLATSHLQLCDPLNEDRPGLNFVGLRSVNGIAEQRFSPANWSHNSLHPNERGHAAMLRTFETWLVANEPLAAVAPSSRVGQPRDMQAGPGLLPPCDLFDPSPAGCRGLGSSWAEQRVGILLLKAGWLAYLMVAAAWTASVAFFAWRRRVRSDATTSQVLDGPG